MKPNSGLKLPLFRVSWGSWRSMVFFEILITPSDLVRVVNLTERDRPVVPEDALE